MLFPKAKAIAKEQDWHNTKNAVFGLYKGYLFNVGDASLLSNPQFKYVIATTDNLTDEQKKALKAELESNKKTLKYSAIEVKDDSIFIQFIENLTYAKIKTLYALLDFLVELFKKINLPEQDKCCNCSAKERLDFYDLNDIGVILCNTCFRATENQFYEIEREKHSEEKNYFTGFLGSVLFSIPAIIGWVLIAVYLERLASAMAIVIAFLGLKGYEFFKGKHGKLTNYIIVFSNIISILIANLSTICFTLLKEGLTWKETILELQINKEVQDLLYKNTMISFVLAFFVWIWLLFLLEDKKMTVQLANKIEK